MAVQNFHDAKAQEIAEFVYKKEKMNDKDLETTLWKIFENINGWLKFAETKNTYLISFLALEVTLLKLRESLSETAYISLFFLIASFIVCVFSFYPKNKIVFWAYKLSKSPEQQSDSDNILFYGHIAKYSVNKYIEKLESSYGCSLKNNKYLNDICGQIVINAGIADEKFSMFKVSFWLMLIGQIFIAVSFLVK